MAKRKYQQKPSSLPKGLPVRKAKRAKSTNSKSNGSASQDINPFESARASSAKTPKFQVHNRPIAGRTSNATKGAGSALRRSIENRRRGLKASMDQSKKAGSFIDRRIGESRNMEMTAEERTLARLVRERSRRSKKQDKYSLNDDDDNSGGLTLTHRGKVIDESYTGRFDADDIILSDDDEKYGGQLEKADTELHFGGGVFDSARRRANASNPYGPAGGAQNESIGDRYRTRKEELDDLIMRKKYEKAEKAKHKEDQVQTFEGMDAQFKELASLLQFRDKEQDRKDRVEAKRSGTLSAEDKEMEDWNKEMKKYIFDRKVKATDRTKTPDEIAKEEAERLHELETKRLARMNGDFEKDDLSDISEDEGEPRKKHKQRKEAERLKKKKRRSPDELDSDEDQDEGLQSRFTADGLIYVDKKGNVVKKHGEDDVALQNNEEDSVDTDDESSESSDDSIGGTDDDASVIESSDGLSSGEESDLESENVVLAVGTKIKAKYRADEQFEGKGKWYKGKITHVSLDKMSGNTTYNVEYDDGDIEEDLKPENVRKQKNTREEREKEEEEKTKQMRLKAKRQKAKDKARTDIPYVFEVPTTLEALHDIIGTYATTGADATLIIERIYTGNSVRLDNRNKEKMQNFYDVLLRRFIGVGDALYKSGDGGDELGRYSQLNSLTATLYAMAQDSPESASAVFGRRIGILQNSLAKRLRDAEFARLDGGEFTAWPSTGTLLLLRSVGHVFPMTDQRHVVCTPTLLLLGQTLGQTPVRSLEDVIKGLFCAGLMIEYTREAKRFPAEALAFLASTLNLFSENALACSKQCPIPTFASVSKFEDLSRLRKKAIEYCEGFSTIDSDMVCSLERKKISGNGTPVAILLSSLRLVDKSVGYFGGALNNAENEGFTQISTAILRLSPGSQTKKLPEVIVKSIAKTALLLSGKGILKNARMPLVRRSGAKVSELAIQSLAPRMEDPDKYAMAKDKNKTRDQAVRDKMRREYKREHKAVSRELRLDAAFIESERRKEKDIRDSKARAARNKNFAWLEQEQATMNQQVAQGGGLLKGGGIGAARSKAATGKLGIKRGGKF